MTVHHSDETGPGERRRERGFTAFGGRVAAPTPEPGLHVVATPIGNLGDISLRALGVLAGADAVLAEDTRVSRVLLNHYGIDTPLVAYHEHNAAAVRPQILARLARGETLALISDAGTPLVSDPGYKLVLDAVAAGAGVTAVPGASAVMAALVLGGLPTDRFFFEGFLPERSGARRTRLADLAAVPGTLVFFESARRLADCLADVAAVLGPRPAAVARELTKRFEEVRRGTAPDLAAHYEAEGAPRGECVLLVARPEAGQAPSADDLEARLAAALDTLSVKDAAAVVAGETGLPRREVYGRAVALAAARRPR
ncbi:16S rRNA (cytidine(1402)-2'-O)-methyltransferase [Lichenibacterium ramalinae]|uniref:Ribosomal RNA small subunit methyltransferase I n=1 Tax=Lichenibacterium ramalinae TaxID=2316527 RepID=A0A4Q2RD80_9HYPH|nr:16S rRNA (cytidine(1402)-2'-O)-methyltransferase [Lichenibacterium ramalinae]RYB04224.1 16S rRNA (cytidine(1402)-2'-O)-methyltransferase [Lichenibacterium ramalinae]